MLSQTSGSFLTIYPLIPAFWNPIPTLQIDYNREQMGYINMSVLRQKVETLRTKAIWITTRSTTLAEYRKGMHAGTFAGESGDEV